MSRPPSEVRERPAAAPARAGVPRWALLAAIGVAVVVLRRATTVPVR